MFVPLLSRHGNSKVDTNLKVRSEIHITVPLICQARVQILSSLEHA